MSDSRRPLFWAACAGMFLFGIVLAILGALFGLPPMRARIHVDLAQQGDIFLVLFLGVFLCTLIVGPVIDSFGNKIVLVISAFSVCATLIGFAMVHSFGAAAACAFVLGFGGGGLNTSANALVAGLYGENRGAMLNVVGAFYGVGALFIPLLAASIAGALTIPQLLLLAAALAALCALGYLILPFPPPREKVGFMLFASIEAVRVPGVLLLALLLLFQSGNESAIGGWASTYFGAAGFSPQTATWILAAYWAAMMIGRLLSAKIVEHVRKETLVLASGIGSAMGCGILLLPPSLITLSAGAAFAGLSFAAIYPTTLAIAADRYQRLAGTIFGLLFAVGLVGAMIFPWAIGQISGRYGVRAGMVLPLAGAVVITVLISVAALRSRAIESGGSE